MKVKAIFNHQDKKLGLIKRHSEFNISKADYRRLSGAACLRVIEDNKPVAAVEAVVAPKPTANKKPAAKKKAARKK